MLFRSLNAHRHGITGQVRLLPDADRGEGFDDGSAEGFDGAAFGVGQETDLAGDAVTVGVEARDFLAFFAAGRWSAGRCVGWPPGALGR